MSVTLSTIEKQVEAFANGSDSEYAFPAELSVEERKLVKTSAEKYGLSTKSFGLAGERKIHVFKRSVSTSPEFEAVKYSVKNTFVDGPVDATESQATPVGPAHQSMPAGGLHACIAAQEMAVPSEQTSTLLEKLSKEAEPPLNSQSGDSTADSDSEAVQDPKIPIKNSFVHFEEDSQGNGDPRIIQSDSEAVQDPTIPIKNSFVHFDGDSDDSGDPRIVQSMPNGKFAETVEAEKKARTRISIEVQDHKSRPLPVSQDPEPVAAMEVPVTPNAETLAYYHGHYGTLPCGMNAQMFDYGQSLPIAQGSSVTILPPASWTPQAPPQCQASVAASQPLTGPQQSSVTVLQPACWTQNSQGLLQAPLPLMPTLDQAPPPLMPALDAAAAPSLMPTLDPATSGTDTNAFPPGTAVMLCGLASQPAFNGLHGTVSSYDADCARYNIMVEMGPDATRRMVKVKVQNLFVAQPMLPPQQPVLPPQIPSQLPCYASGPHPGYSYGPQVPVPTTNKATLTLDAMI